MPHLRAGDAWASPMCDVDPSLNSRGAIDTWQDCNARAYTHAKHRKSQIANTNAGNVACRLLDASVCERHRCRAATDA